MLQSKNQNEIYKMIIWGWINAFGTTTFTLFSFFRKELMYGTWVNANHLCHMALAEKPERDSAKQRYKLIECMQV